ncbi:MAG: hypothetical protein F6K55_28975 [Moorea sp. SIO4A3]|nr:hypothetical protein [Moorena sp. SIO4A3]
MTSINGHNCSDADLMLVLRRLHIDGYRNAISPKGYATRLTVGHATRTQKQIPTTHGVSIQLSALN